METLLREGGIGLYLFIFFGKILEVTVSTVRLVLINRGERVKGSVIAFFEILLWLTVTGTVLAGFQSDWFRCVIFAVAFSIGNYLGSWLEDRLAFGLCSLQVIVPECSRSQELAKILRQYNFAVTTIKGRGKDGERELMLLHIKRKRIREAEAIIKQNLPDAVIAINDARVVHGGFIRR